MDELRSWFEVPAIAHYFHIFRTSFDLIDFDIEDFEETLLVDCSKNVSSFLPDLVIRLLRGLYKTKDGLQVTLDNYGHYLHDLLNFHYGFLQKKENPLLNTTFKDLRTRTKVEILYDMINWRLDLEDSMELTKNMEAEEMRVEPVGKDNDGNVYWYFYGSRLYKEGFSIKNEESLDESEAELKNGKSKKRKKKAVAQTRSGRAIRKKRKVDSSSDESGSESEKSVEIPDDESTSSSLKHDLKPLKLNISFNVWSMICSSVDGWEGLIEKLKGATSRNEKQLLKNLEELYDGIPAIIKEREEKLQKKLLAMAPRRVSDRITYKMQQRDAEERLQEQERILRKQQKAKEEEERQKQLEVERAEEREKRYKEREKIQEQRALRAKLREEQKIVRVNPEFAKFLPASPNPSLRAMKKESSYTSEPEEEEEEDNDYSSMSIVLEVLKEHDDAWLFLQPVKEEEAPNYYTFIKNPMDFQTIGEKIKSKAYKDKFEFESDILLIFDNCETYNGTFSPFTKLAFKVKKQFHKLMKREFPPDIHEDDDDFFENDDHPTKAKKTKVSRSLNSSQSSPRTSIINHSSPHIKKERKPRKEKVTIVPSEVLTPKSSHLKPKPIQNITQTTPVSQLSPISATNFLSTRFGIPPYVLKQMSPAQMQSLILRYPRAGFVPALQGLMGHKLNVSSNSVTTMTSVTNVTNVVGTTTLSPLHQLANTALAPALSPVSMKSVSIALPILPKNITPGPIISKSPPGVRVFNASQGQSTLGRPRKNTFASASILSTSTGGYVSGLSVSGVPVTIQWDELKKQLMAQMVPTASSTASTLAPGKYVSGVTVSGAPITIEWEELKKQLVSQMKKEDNSNTPLNKENIAMSLLHLNSCIGDSMVTVTPASTMSGIPSLRPVSIPAAIPFRLSKDLNVATTTTPANSKMFSFSNVLKNKESSTTPAKPITIKTPTFDCTTSAVTVESVAKTTSPLSLSTAKLQSGHSKVQDWLQSSSPFIVQSADGTRPITKVTSCIQNVIVGETKVTDNEPVSSGNSTSLRFISNQVTSVVQTPLSLSGKDSRVMEFIPRPSFLTSSPSKIIPIPLPNVHHMVTAIGNNQMNIIPIKGQIGSQGRSFTSVVNKSNLLELQKAALQAAAVNQISSKLQNHLRKDQLKEKKNEAYNYVIKDSILGNMKYKKTNEVVTMYQPNDALTMEIIDRRTTENINSYIKKEIVTGSSVVMSQLTITTASSIVVSHLNNFSSDQLINSSCMQTVSETTIPVTQSRILIMPNRSFNESSGVSFSSSGQVNLQPARPFSVVSQAITNRFNPLIVTTAASKISLINPTTPSSCNSLPFVKAPIPIQLPQSPGSQLITTLPSTKYLAFAPKPVVMQQSQLSKLIVPLVPPLSKISQPRVARFQTISSDIPVLQPKSNITNKQVILQQRLRDQGQGQAVRYILPAQTQLPSGQVINLNQLGSVQNLFINNMPVAKNQTTKSVRIVSGNLSNGIAKSSTNNKVVVTPSLGVHRYPNASSITSVGNSTHMKINETIVMRSPVKACNPSDNKRLQVTQIASINPILAIPSNTTPKKPDTIENTAICNSLTYTPKIESNSQVNDNSSSLPRQSIHLKPSVIPDTRKLLPKTALASLPNGICTQTLPTSSLSSNNMKSPDAKSSEKQRHVVLEPAQLQKLKEEGRIVMTPTGQLIMIPPNLVGKVPGSVFK